MKSKVAIVGGFAAGYVVGARAGRQRYEELKARSQEFVASPAVQEKAEALKTFATEKAPKVGRKAGDQKKQEVPETGHVGAPVEHDAGLGVPLTPQETVSQEEVAGRPPAAV
jgi:thioredoxin reductase